MFEECGRSTDTGRDGLRAWGEVEKLDADSQHQLVPWLWYARELNTYRSDGHMTRRRRRLLTTCGVFLVYVLCCHLIATHMSPSHPDDTAKGGRRLLQLPAEPSPGFNCSRPAIERFPPPGMGQAARRQGGVVLYMMGALYCFLALAIVCDDYFVPALEVMANTLQLSEDVAGATFLAAGSSAPEFATTVLGVFVTKDDIGISGVIGSAVFNAMLVISLVSLLVHDVIKIKRYPMLRDTGCYMVAIAALLCVIYDNTITWYESLILVLLYVLYCLLMWKNRALQRFILDRCVKTRPSEKQSLMTRQHVSSADDVEDSDISEAVQREMTGQVRDVPFNNQSPFEVPDSLLGRVMFVISLPVLVACYLTLPDVGKPTWRPFYVITFIMAMLWIAIYSYVMIWMITVVGFTLNIPDTIMGLSFVAIGVSIPDVLASVAVARDGYGDMAISNALGSNVFDILFCMGVPWLLSTAVVTPGSTVTVDSGGVLYSTVFLFTTVVFLLAATSIAGWRLSRPYGISLLVWYAIFLIIACMYEMNFFGQLTLPMCPSTF